MQNKIDNKTALYIGKVEAVRGRSVEINVHKSKNSPNLIFNGKIIKGVSVGSYVKICKGFQELIGKVDEEYITENKLISQKDYKQEKERIKRILKLSLVGYFEGGNFKQGIKELPLLDNEAFILEEDEFDAVHNFIKKFSDENGEKKLDAALKIGVLSNEKGLPIKIGVNSLFASHIGIFGNTGSGKSYTLASLYHRLFEEYGTNDEFKKNAKFLLIDFNGEYSKAITADSNKEVYELSTGKSGSTKKFPIKEEQIKDVEFWSILLEATEKTQKPFLRGALNSKEYIYKMKSFKDLKSLVVNIISLLVEKKSEKADIIKFIEYFNNCFFAKINVGDLQNIIEKNLHYHSNKQVEKYYYNSNFCQECKNSNNRCFAGSDCFKQIIENVILKNINLSENIIYEEISDLTKIRFQIVCKYYGDLVKEDKNIEFVGFILKRLNRIEDLDKIITIKKQPEENEDNQKNLTIISLHGVNQDVKKVFPLLISKQYYSEKKEDNDKEKYLNIIIDEAHNILSYDSKRESETWKDYRLETFEEIIKEGRKFGVFLTIASQRPSDISDTIISQLHNYFLHRLVNEKDILAIGRTVSYLDKISFESLPILPTGSCILAGLSAQIPVIIDVDKIDEGFEPDNKTIIPTNYWGNPRI